jgi:predicted RNase H-like HicB family nuclease
MRYAIVIEKAGENFSGYAPDLPGCVATGATVEEAESELREAIEFHLAGLREDGTPIPPHPAASITSTLRYNHPIHNDACKRFAVLHARVIGAR